MGSTIDNAEKAEHIRALNKINEDVASLLRSVGTAVKTLTNSPSPNLDAGRDPVEVRKEVYRTETSQFITLFTRIRDSLGVEADALEDAKLITAKPPPPAATLREDEQSITNGGMGKFDVGWLNSRGNGVMRGKEREIWAEVRQMLERREAREEHHDSSKDLDEEQKED